MTDRLISPPVEMPISIEAARLAARVDSTALDSELEVMVRSLTEEGEHYTGRAIINQTWRVTLDWFEDSIELPRSPVVAVSALGYFDEDGNQQVLDPADYILDLESAPSYIVPGIGVAWPDIQSRVNAVHVDVICGYGPDHTTTPPAFAGWLLAKIKEAYTPGAAPNPHLIRKLDSLKVY